LQPGDKVAITSKHSNNDSSVQRIVQALEEERGLKVRVIENQFDFQDFCFLMKAQKELVGMVRSTYVKRASYLSDAKTIRWYVLDNNPGLLRAGHTLGSSNVLQEFNYSWTHPDLQSRIRLELYQSEELEASLIVNPTTIPENRMNDTYDSAGTDQDLDASLVNPTTSENQVDDTKDSEVVTDPASDNEPFTVANNTSTIVVQLSGELGNQLSKISLGIGLQLLAKDKYGIDMVIKLRALQHSKWMRGKYDTKARFPNTRPLNFQNATPKNLIT
jgi:hypothetical protein